MFPSTLQLSLDQLTPDPGGEGKMPMHWRGDPHFTKQGAHAAKTAVLNTDYDVFPPGFREQMLNPAAPDFSPYQSSLYNTFRTAGNAAPMMDWDGNDVGPPLRNNIFLSKQNQRLGAYLHQTLVTEADELRVTNIDMGQWSAPVTGFTAFRHLKPNSTKKFI